MGWYRRLDKVKIGEVINSVKELIKELQQINPDLPIYVDHLSDPIIYTVEDVRECAEQAHIISLEKRNIETWNATQHDKKMLLFNSNTSIQFGKFTSEKEIYFIADEYISINLTTNDMNGILTAFTKKSDE